MALIVCVECGKEFSDKAEACPNCGCPTEDILQELKEKAFKDSIYKDATEELPKESQPKEEDVITEKDSLDSFEELNDLDLESKDENITEAFTIPIYDNSSKFDKLSKGKLQDRRPEGTSPMNMKKVAIIGVAIILLLVCIVGIRSALKDRINWNDIVLGEMLPEPDSHKGYIWENSAKNLNIDIYETSTNDYYAYISECSEEDFLIDPETEEFSYSAYNKEGYRLEVTYSEYSEEMSINMEDPIRLEAIDWNFDGLGAYIPKLDSNKGKIIEDGKKAFSLYVGDVDQIEFEKYVKGCSEKGFDISSVTTDKSYKAKNSERYCIEVEYIGFNIIKVTMYEPVYIVNINVSCLGNLFMNKYDVYASIDENISLGIVKHGKMETFQAELPKGTHTLYCVNDISDEVYEDYDATGKTKFEVTGDMDLSFELYCRTDSIDVDLISDEKESDKGEYQNTTKEKKKLGENEVMVPESASMYRGDKYQDVKNELQSLGFKNIQTKAVYDLGTGWLGRSSVDDVKTISIAGNKDFDKGAVFNKDDKIVITYRKYEIDNPSIKYEKYTVEEMMNDLDDNAARAKEKYYGKYVEITGRVNMIDSSASSFDLIPTNNSWEIRSVTCDAKTEDHEKKIMNISNNDVITVRGKINIANEWGYNMSIYSFK